MQEFENTNRIFVIQDQKLINNDLNGIERIKNESIILSLMLSLYRVFALLLL